MAMDAINISYAEIVEFYEKLGIDTKSGKAAPQASETPAGWEMPTAFDNTQLVFSYSSTNSF